jgi:hypothetical protein
MRLYKSDTTGELSAPTGLNRDADSTTTAVSLNAYILKATMVAASAVDNDKSVNRLRAVDSEHRLQRHIVVADEYEMTVQPPSTASLGAVEDVSLHWGTRINDGHALTM